MMRYTFINTLVVANTSENFMNFILPSSDVKLKITISNSLFGWNKTISSNSENEAL